MYQPRFALSREARDSRNQGCRSEVWFGTKSRMILRPTPCTSRTSASNSSSVPKRGSMPQ
ncbi:hypothetical protein BE20_54460 [Sorangium cellulosum]|uniref:Uncharacterized protein n=1 Tax=Sorangium cellulosum TaxID=56 RepID=A0A150T818_SORCE|nr:hypothetical protein BE18_52265 [Sorangium cellulosum]KYG00820.1 hypothetical protein BE20_54460 [Sorangium cellulosum]